MVSCNAFVKYATNPYVLTEYPVDSVFSSYSVPSTKSGMIVFISWAIKPLCPLESSFSSFQSKLTGLNCFILFITPSAIEIIFFFNFSSDVSFKSPLTVPPVEMVKRTVPPVLNLGVTPAEEWECNEKYCQFFDVCGGGIKGNF